MEKLQATTEAAAGKLKLALPRGADVRVFLLKLALPRGAEVRVLLLKLALLRVRRFECSC